MESPDKRAETSMKTEDNHIKVSFHLHPTGEMSLTFSNQKIYVSLGNQYNVVGCNSPNSPGN